MSESKTVYVYPEQNRWTVKKLGGVRRSCDTKKAALTEARALVKSSSDGTGQVLVLGADGRVALRRNYGLPPVRPAVKAGTISPRELDRVFSSLLMRQLAEQ